MTELQQKPKSVEEIRQIIKDKKWYGYEEDGAFSFKKSVALLTERAGLGTDPATLAKIEEAIENSFDQEALARTEEGYFIDLLLAIDPNLILWSEGDPPWQKIKSENTGLTNKVPNKEFINNAKTNHLSRIMRTIAKEHLGEQIHILAIDDKKKNLAAAQALSPQMALLGIEIVTFQINLGEDGADATACMEFITQLQSTTQNKIRIIADMDGTLIRTDEVMVGTVPQKIAEALGIK